jgi:hypothetical protein
VKYTYGDSWERYPIEAGEVWGLSDGSKVAVHDIFDPLPAWMQADLLFVDPPYNGGQLQGYYTKAELTPADFLLGFAFDHFVSTLFDRIQEIGAQTVYIEMGNQAIDVFQRELESRFEYVQHWPVLYYRKHATNLLRGSHLAPTPLDFTGIDEARCISILAEQESYETIADPCMGRGLVGLAAYKSGHRFVGTELNKRRLAVLLDKLAKVGAQVAQLDERR